MQPSDFSDQELEAIANEDYAAMSERALIWLANQKEPKQKPEREPYSAPMRYAYGMSEPLTGAAQFVYNAMPEFVQQAGTKADQFLHDVTGGIVGKEQPFNEAVRAQEQWYQQGAPEGLDAARLFGNITTGILATRGLPAPTSLGGATAQGAGLGAGFGVAAPVYQDDYWDTKTDQVTSGTAAGAVLGPVGYGISRALSPTARPEVRALQREGITPTLGPRLGPTVGRVEDQVQSVPFFGDVVRAARAGKRDDFNKLILNKSVESVGGKVDDIGTDGVAAVQKLSDEAYRTAENMIKGFRLDKTAVGELTNIRRMASNMDDISLQRFEKFWKKELMPKFKTGGITTKSYKEVDSRLGDLALKNANNEAGGAFKELKALLKRQAERANPDYRKALDAADEAFTKRVIVEKAANSASGTGGVFTPKQLLSAAKTTDRTKRHGKAAGGKRPFQKLAGAASEVIGDNYPDSGTAARMFMGGGLLGAGAYDPSILGYAAALYGLGRGMYSPVGQKAIYGFANNVPQAIGRGAPLMTPALLPQ